MALDRQTVAEQMGLKASERCRRRNFLPPEQDLPISWNIAPTQDILAIRFNPETTPRTLDILPWGLIPSWVKDEKTAYKTINARVETVYTAASYREAFKKQRCLIPAGGFYEWKKVLGGKSHTRSIEG